MGKISSQVETMVVHNKNYKVLKIKDWSTIASSYKLEKKGNAEITRIEDTKGFYTMDGVRGYAFYEIIKKPIKVTNLLINKKTMMVDDPYHWEGMKELVKDFYGNVLCVGLGLGLGQRILSDNPKVTNIETIEVNPDVISLIAPYLKGGQTIIERDFWHPDWSKDVTPFDCVLIDIWVADEQTSENTRLEMLKEMQLSITRIEMLYPKAKIKIWGLHDAEYGYE